MDADKSESTNNGDKHRQDLNEQPNGPLQCQTARTAFMFEYASMRVVFCMD